MSIKKISLLGLLSVSAIVPLFLSNSCSLTSHKAEESDQLKDLIKNNSSYSMSDIYYSKTLKTYKKTLNQAVYKTELESKYANLGFKYPAWNNNYRDDATDRRKLSQNEIDSNGLPKDINSKRYLLKKGGNSLSKSDYIDVSLEIYKEKTTLKDKNGKPILDDKSQEQKLMFRDPKFINQEIENGTFKRHPWAKDAYLNGPGGVANVVEKEFVLGTGMIGWTTLGLYAPAGEVITLKFDDSTFKLMQEQNFRGLEIYINEGYWDQDQGFNGAPTEPEVLLTKQSIGVRMPYMQSIFRVDSTKKEIKFGTPYGGTISLKINDRLKKSSSSIERQVYAPLKFKIEGAIENLHYVHGVTTEEDWNNQLNKVRRKEIVSPVFSAYFTFASIHIPFTNNKENEFEIGHYKINEFQYPKEVFDKMYDFLFLSTYVARHDIHGNAQRESFKFSDDIWGGAGAWGGTYYLFAPSDWGAQLFLLGLDYFNARDGWGVFHEINHAWQQNDALFRKRGHPETNQVNTINFSLLNDSSRFRNPMNIYNDYLNGTGDWSRLNSPYGIMNVINNKLVKKDSSEYEIYSLLLHNWGTYNYMDYVRWDQVNHPSSASDWNGFDEVFTFSNKFKLNYWPTFEKYGQVFWRDTWPETTAQATAEQKKKIKELEEKYPAVDLMANLYAAGMYFYNSDAKAFQYTNDTAAPYEIIAGKDYTFDFGTYISTYNTDFEWDKIEFSPTTKTGATLIQQDPKNPKKITYKPNINKIDEIDEFDITIKPTSAFTSKYKNYVPGYKWKIKVRQVTNLPVISWYNDLEENVNFNSTLNMIDQNQINPIYTGLTNLQMPSPFKTENKAVLKTEFRYVVPKTGNYRFKAKWDDYLRLKVNGEIVFRQDSWSPRFKSIYEKQLNEGEILNIEIVVFNIGGAGNLLMKLFVNDNRINILNNTLAPNLQHISNVVNNELDFITDKKYQYKARKLDYSKFKQISNFLATESSNTAVDSQTFSLENKTYKNNNGTIEDKPQNSSPYDVDKVINDSSNRELKFELANNNCNNGNLSVNRDNWQPTMSFDVHFNQKQKISGVTFLRARQVSNIPTYAKITGYDDSNKEFILYDGKYGQEFNDGEAEKTIINFDNTYTNLTKVSFYFENKRDQVAQGIIALRGMKFLNERAFRDTNAISVDNMFIKNYGNWKYITNDSNLVLSPYNNISIWASKKESTMSFDLLAQGFELMGSKTPNNTLFDVYVNDELISENVTTFSNNVITNTSLFRYSTNSVKKLKVKIILKNDSPIYISYLNILGKNGELIRE